MIFLNWNKAESKIKSQWLRKSPVRYMITKQHKRIWTTNKFFNNLHDKWFLTSLGGKVKIPKIPKSLRPNSRLSSAKKRERPWTAAIARITRSSSKSRYVKPRKLWKYKSRKNDYFDGYSSSLNKSKQSHNSFEKRSMSMQKRLQEIEQSIII